jgi:hypothetical protein
MEIRLISSAQIMRQPAARLHSVQVGDPHDSELLTGAPFPKSWWGSGQPEKRTVELDEAPGELKVTWIRTGVPRAATAI